MEETNVHDQYGGSGTYLPEGSDGGDGTVVLLSER